MKYLTELLAKERFCQENKMHNTILFEFLSKKLYNAYQTTHSIVHWIIPSNRLWNHQFNHKSNYSSNHSTNHSLNCSSKSSSSYALNCLSNHSWYHALYYSPNHSLNRSSNRSSNHYSNISFLYLTNHTSAQLWNNLTKHSSERDAIMLGLIKESYEESYKYVWKTVSWVTQQTVLFIALCLYH